MTPEPIINFTAHTLAPGDVSAAEMRSWKALVAAAAGTGQPICLNYQGGANLITSYRLYYMLIYAKQAGVRTSLQTNATFLTDEAKMWLTESGVDHIVIAAPRP